MVEYTILDENVQNVTQFVRALLTSPGLEPRQITSPNSEADDATLPSLIHSTIFQNFQVTLKNN